MRHINHGIHQAFAYVRKSTAVNSPIAVSLASRQGVCQDFAHIMTALVRGLGFLAATSADTCSTMRRTTIDQPKAPRTRGLKR